MQNTVRRVLFIRIDRMGDLVLTLPTDQLASKMGAVVDWWIPKGLSFITERAIPPRAALEIAREISIRQWFQLLLFLKKNRYDAALIFHAPWWVSALVWAARIPLRCGNKSQWHSYLFLNRGLRQKRSRVAMHELQYNYQLTQQIFPSDATDQSGTYLKLGPPPTMDPSKRALLPHHYVVVHPGMGGSALNWTTDNYIELIRKLSLTSEVVVTGTKADEQYLAPIKASLHDVPRIRFLDGAFTGDELLWVLRGAGAVVAPSTGVLHLAASLGVPTLGLFSPVKVESAERWGPIGERVKVIGIAADPLSAYNEAVALARKS